MISKRARLQKTLTRHVMRPCLSTRRSLEQQRTWLDRLGALSPLPWGTRILPAEVGGVPGEWLANSGADGDRLVIYLHGGGYCIGSPRSHRNIAARMARGLACPVWLPEYRLAPEHPFPAPLYDVLRMYRALLARGVTPDRIVLAGDSAGGGLVLASCMLMRQLGLALPRALLCISPWVDLSLSGQSIDTLAAVDPLVDRQWIDWLASEYCQGEDRRHPLISPLHGQFHDLPPVLLQLGSDEMLRSEVELLHQRLLQAGVASELQIGEGMWHDWPLFGGLMPEADAAIDHAVQFLRRAGGWQEQARPDRFPVAA